MKRIICFLFGHSDSIKVIKISGNWRMTTACKRCGVNFFFPGNLVKIPKPKPLVKMIETVKDVNKIFMKGTYKIKGDDNINEL